MKTRGLEVRRSDSPPIAKKMQAEMRKLESARKRKDEQAERIRKAEAKLLLRKGGDI